MGLLAAAGFITGEALLGIGLAVPVAVAGDKNALTAFQRHSYADFNAARRDPASSSRSSLLYKLALRPEPKRKTPTS